MLNAQADSGIPRYNATVAAHPELVSMLVPVLRGRGGFRLSVTWWGQASVPAVGVSRLHTQVALRATAGTEARPHHQFHQLAGYMQSKSAEHIS